MNSLNLIADELQYQYPGNFDDRHDAESAAGRIVRDIEGDMPPKVAIQNALEAHAILETDDGVFILIEEAYYGRDPRAAE